MTEFGNATRDDWLKRVSAVLKGADFVGRLTSMTGDGIRIDPLYGRQAGPSAARAVAAPWIVQARADHPDATRRAGHC